MKEKIKIIYADEVKRELIVTTGGINDQVIGVEKPKGKEKKVLSDKARQALNIIKPLALEVMIDRGIATEDESDYFMRIELLDRSGVDDYRERYRLACVVLTKEKISAKKAAEVILKENPDIVASLTLGSRDRIEFDKAVGDFADKIVSYYPRNFPKNAAYPQR